MTLAGKRVAIANRGEIAVRIAATCRRLGAIPILLLGSPDMGGYAARQVGRVEVVGEAGAELDVPLVVAAARRAQADFLHPGYGFLSERAVLAEACLEAGIQFVGPSAETLRLCGDKLATREAAARAGVPMLPASAPLGDEPEEWLTAGREVGYPLLVKPAGAGGGRGLRHVADETRLAEAVAASRRESTASGAGALVYLERELIAPRHVEVQVVADGARALALGDRDCSIQRRHQKVIEEAPAPHVDEMTRAALHDHARRIAVEVGLYGIATCEFLLGADGETAFLEVNPRIQVEHPVTELVTGVDLVAWQMHLATGGRLPVVEAAAPRGHAIEARIYAEDPAAGFLPSAGRLATVAWPVGPDLRVDAGYGSGDVVPATYDPMLAKVIARGADRDSALATLRAALLDTIVVGVTTNVPWLMELLDDHVVRAGRATTSTAATVASTMPARDLAPVAAAAYLLDHAPSPSAESPWAALGPWRLAGEAVITLHGAADDDWEERVIAQRTSAGWEATLGAAGDLIRWWRDGSGVWTVASTERVAKLAVVERGDGLEVVGDGGRWLMQLGPKPVEVTGAGARRERASDGRVAAPLPASVLGIHVAAGDRVERGAPLVTLNAMKMELVVEAPAAGLVETISCQVGELVAADQLLVTLRTGAATAVA